MQGIDKDGFLQIVVGWWLVFEPAHSVLTKLSNKESL